MYAPYSPRVSVIIAHKDYNQYILSALCSVLEQDYHADIKFCIVDDGSKDVDIFHNQILKLIKNKRMVINDSGIIIEGENGSIILLKESGGPSRARNIGINHMWEDTDVFCILDADDIMKVNKISRCVSVLGLSDVIGVVYADYSNYNIDSKTKIREFKEPFNVKRLQEECIVNNSCLIKKQVLADVKEGTMYYDERLRTCEDYDLWFRISEKYMIFHIPEDLTLLRVHNKNSTNSISKEVWSKNWETIYQKTRKRNEKKY